MSWSVFDPETPPLELFARASVTYLVIFFLLRVVLKRQAATLGMADLLVIVLIADAAQNAMSDSYRSVPDGLLLVATILFWSYALDWLGHRFPVMRRLVHPPSLLLVRDGRMLRRNMQKELITDDELMSQVRQHGIASLDEVESAYMESDGRISVVPRNGRREDRAHHDRLAV